MAYDIDTLGQGGLLRRGESANTLIVVIHGLRMDASQWLPLLRFAGADPEFAGMRHHTLCEVLAHPFAGTCQHFLKAEFLHSPQSIWLAVRKDNGV